MRTFLKAHWDLLGRVYEYFLSQLASAEGKKGGKFRNRRGEVLFIIVRKLGRHLIDALRSLQERREIVGDVRGLDLMPGASWSWTARRALRRRPPTSATACASAAC